MKSGGSAVSAQMGILQRRAVREARGDCFSLLLV